MKKQILAASLLLGTSVVATNASAVPFDMGGYFGDVQFVFGAIDAGTTGYETAPGVPGTVCASVLACDAVGTVHPDNIGSEDTSGVFEITAIKALEANAGFGVLETIWQSGPGGELTGVFFDLKDQRVDVSAGGLVQAWATGGQLKMFYDETPDYTVGASSLRGGNNDGGVNPWDYPGATEGDLFLDMVFSPTADVTVASSTYQSTFLGSSFTGFGSGYLDFVGGSGLPFFKKNGVSDLNGVLHDVDLLSSFNCTAGSTTCDSSVPGNLGWTAVASGNAKSVAAVVPVPAPLALLGGGLIGLVGLRRRRQS